MSEMKVRNLRTFAQRLKGLLGTGAHDTNAMPVIIENCSSVHTFGMRYDIDIAFVNAGYFVIATHRGVRPGKILKSPRARYVLERPASREAWPLKGQRIAIDANKERGREYRYVQF